MNENFASTVRKEKGNSVVLVDEWILLRLRNFQDCFPARHSFARRGVAVTGPFFFLSSSFKFSAENSRIRESETVEVFEFQIANLPTKKICTLSFVFLLLSLINKQPDVLYIAHNIACTGYKKFLRAGFV